MVSSYSVNCCAQNVCVEWTMKKATVAVVSVRKRDRGIISTTEFHCAMSTRHCFLLHFLWPNQCIATFRVNVRMVSHLGIKCATTFFISSDIFVWFQVFGSHWDTTISQSATPLETNFKIFPLFDVSKCRGSKTAHTVFHFICQRWE